MMKKLVLLMLGVLMSCTPNVEQIEEEEEMPTFIINSPSPTDRTIYGVMKKRNMLVDDWMYIKLRRGILDDHHHQKYIDLGKKVYEKHFYEVFDPKIYTREDSLFIKSILVTNPEEYFYIGYIYNREHLHSCKTRCENNLYKSSTMVNNQ